MFDVTTAEAAYCALGAANTRVHSLPTTLGIDYRIINGRIYIGGNAVTDPVEIARRTKRIPATSLLLLRALGRIIRAVEKQDAGINPGRRGATEAFAARVRTPGARPRRTRHCVQPLPPRHLPEDARRLLPHVAPSLRVSAARVWRLSDFFRFLQKGISGNQRPDRGPHGGRYGSGNLSTRR